MLKAQTNIMIYRLKQTAEYDFMRVCKNILDNPEKIMGQLYKKKRRIFQRHVTSRLNHHNPKLRSSVHKSRHSAIMMENEENEARKKEINR